VDARGRLRIEAEFRERFMGILAHDLRQPLNAMNMAAHALSKPELPTDKATQFLAMHSRAAARMQRMITELLDFTRSRPEAGMPLQKRETNFPDLVTACLQEMRVSHPERDFLFVITGDCSGNWDPDRISQVCGNLLTNAVEHSFESSSVHVDVDCQPDRVELRVRSSGPSITKEAQAAIFEPFRRARTAKPANGGVGLGLHIVHEIVRAHGGSISVESENEQTTFLVMLPRDSGLVLA
jgi:signal transduction histidine kinase